MIARALPAILVLMALTTVAMAKNTWVSVKEFDGVGNVCLESGGRPIDYAVFGPGDEGHCSVTGPRRLKLISRYLFADGDADRMPYTIIVELDGREVLRKGFTGRPFDEVVRCGGGGQVGSLRRDYLELAAGKHRLTLRAEHEGGGQVAMRIFREVKRQRQHWVTFAPETYGSVRKLQFESGNQSTYYHFDADAPLRFSVAGSTTLRVGTRLDFDHTMNGSQTYTLEVLLDDEVWRSFHFDATKLSSAQYVDRPDILPGSRNEFRIAIPRDRHDVEIRCVRPDACGVAAMIHIPKSDLER